MAGFIFGDFSEQETEKFFGHDQQSVKVNEPEFPWATEECLSTTIEFGFDVPSVISPNPGHTGVSYPNYNSYNGSSSHQESTSSALTSPPYSSKSSSIENVKISKQSSSSSRHHSERKLKKKRPPNYYRQEYQQMLEPSTLQQLNGQKDETTPIETHSEETKKQLEQNSTETNLFLLPASDARYISCDQWVDSTMQHNKILTQNDDDDQSSSKQSINDDDDIESESHDTTTDTDNDTELQQSSSTTRPSFPVNINQTERNIQIKSNTNENAQFLNPQNNDLNIYSTSVASGASIETLKPSNNPPSPPSPVKQTKPSSWADLFRSQSKSSTPIVVPPVAAAPPSPTPSAPSAPSVPSAQPVVQPSTINNKSQPTETTTTTTKSNSTNFYSRTNYHVYNSNGGESKSLEDYFSKCEVRPSAMAIKPRGLQNKNNYCYVNATLQALLACPAFFNVMKYIPLNEDPIDHQVPLIKSIHKFVNQFEKMDRSKSTSNASTPNHKDIVCGQSFDPIDVLEEIARLRRIPIEIVQNQQEDAHELLTQLLNELHEEICSILYPNKSEIADEISPPTTETTTTTTVNGEEKAEDWLQVGKKNRTHVLRTNELRKSLVADIFAGKFRSTVHSAGNQKSVIHEPFFTLSLDIKDPKITTLDEALIRFCEQSNLSDFVDTKTRQQINTNKTMLIEQLPPILIIHLKCFLYEEADGTKKLMKLINYSINLTLPKSILADSAKKQPERYKLFAVEHHQGDQASKGHYVTDVFHPGLQGWIRFNDANVQVVPSNHVINPNLDKLTPYLLFYRRGD